MRDISVAPLNADDLTLLEQMMDQEDGVRNRKGKKNWKRSYSMSLRRPRLSSQYVQHRTCNHTDINPDMESIKTSFEQQKQLAIDAT